MQHIILLVDFPSSLLPSGFSEQSVVRHAHALWQLPCFLEIFYAYQILWQKIELTLICCETPLDLPHHSLLFPPNSPVVRAKCHWAPLLGATFARHHFTRVGPTDAKPPSYPQPRSLSPHPRLVALPAGEMGCWRKPNLNEGIIRRTGLSGFYQPSPRMRGSLADQCGWNKFWWSIRNVQINFCFIFGVLEAT